MYSYLKVTLNRQALEAAIARQNLSWKELAYELGISSNYLSLVICGSKKPSAAMRRRFLKFFREYTFDQLFTLEEDRNADRITSKRLRKRPADTSSVDCPGSPEESGQPTKLTN
jgi:transcriptional regulator with XRE-family HTH domain